MAPVQQAPWTICMVVLLGQGARTAALKTVDHGAMGQDLAPAHHGARAKTSRAEQAFESQGACLASHEVNPPDENRQSSSTCCTPNSYDANADFSMLDTTSGARSWVPYPTYYNGVMAERGETRGPTNYDFVGSWLQIDLGDPMLVAGLVTQGRGGLGTWNAQYATSYQIAISDDGTNWVDYEGPKDVSDQFLGEGVETGETKATSSLDEPILARYVRMYPLTFRSYPSTRAAVVVCDTTAPPTPAPASATGDPHLQNIHGQRFDLMRPGKSVLIQIPLGQPVEKALLTVEADARRLGLQCADIYFQSLNITGAWADKVRAGGLAFTAGGDETLEMSGWTKFGPLKLKVVNGRTTQGIEYLNFYVKHLSEAGAAIGGLLGEDDFTEAATPEEGCRKSMSLKRATSKSDVGHTEAIASLA